MKKLSRKGRKITVRGISTAKIFRSNDGFLRFLEFSPNSHSNKVTI